MVKCIFYTNSKIRAYYMIGGSGSCNKATVDDGITPITEKRCCLRIQYKTLTNIWLSDINIIIEEYITIEIFLFSTSIIKQYIIISIHDSKKAVEISACVLQSTNYSLNINLGQMQKLSVAFNTCNLSTWFIRDVL